MHACRTLSLGKILVQQPAQSILRSQRVVALPGHKEYIVNLAPEDIGTTNSQAFFAQARTIDHVFNFGKVDELPRFLDGIPLSSQDEYFPALDPAEIPRAIGFDAVEFVDMAGFIQITHCDEWCLDQNLTLVDGHLDAVYGASDRERGAAPMPDGERPS